mmetsp:Transcript_14503/g.20747  ORF Transcript_14503/g.20747 Transcript_14503/m.20747 type:complete len:226 (+) Transcript_14503:297-974(+)|eukprot:CAMPEP_0172432264 /NCGR_PEP_ID=MMETSP1064-20121228/62354_1 /TAXON_ID=202472 /ORGANISM="Aulacoseira subarctica , Strain CCAP 1002/5" /LENGTH=225 /DNA_ID=CAMNT_0013179449 /DNA_START=251 /DNA_END=928 /DNA_ORIENTATION=-
MERHNGIPDEVFQEIMAEMQRKYLAVNELATDHEATIQVLQAEIKHLNDVTDSLNTENGELANDLLDVIAENEELQEKYNNVVNRNNNLRAKNETLRAERDDLAEGIENMLQAGEVEETIQKIKYSVKHRMKRFSVERKALENELTKVSLEKGDLLDEFQFLCEKFNQMQRSAAEKNLVIENLKKTIEDQSLNKGFVNSKRNLLLQCTDCERGNENISNDGAQII